MKAEIETWESDTRYNFDIGLEFERIQCGLQEVKRFLDKNHMSYTLNPELDTKMKNKPIHLFDSTPSIFKTSFKEAPST